MKTDVSRQAAQTLAAVNAVLDGDVPHWTDPAFLAWERDQVGPVADRATNGAITRTTYDTGPGHWLTSNDVGLEVEDTIRISPMIDLYEDHPWCTCEDDPGNPTLRRRMLMSAADYPPPGQTTHGPLLLGPEPPIVGTLCATCVGTGEVLLGDIVECDECDGTGRQYPELAW